MSVPQQKIRELVFQLLYSLDHAHNEEEALIPLLMEQLAVTKKTVKEALKKAKNIYQRFPEIDEQIKSTTKTYEFDRIQSVERNILRLGIFEMLEDDSVPAKVAIAEAMRLARKFSTPQSASFINAVLDVLYKNSMGEKVNDQVLEDSMGALDSYHERVHDVLQQHLEEDIADADEEQSDTDADGEN